MDRGVFAVLIVFVASVCAIVFTTAVIPRTPSVKSAHDINDALTERQACGALCACEILNASMHAVEQIESLSGDAFFMQSVSTCAFHEHSNISFHIRITKENDCRKIRIDFSDYDYAIESVIDGATESRDRAHERMRIMLQNAWILENCTEYRIFMPELSEQVKKFPVHDGSIFPYDMPLADTIHLAALFENAENASYEGVARIGNKRAYVISYELRYPIIPFAARANLRTWISTSDLIPLKAEVHAVYAPSASQDASQDKSSEMPERKEESTKIKLCFGFSSNEI